MERLLSNLHDRNIVIWMLDAKYWHTQNWSNKPAQTPSHPIELINCKPYLLAAIQYHTNNPLLANYVTSPYNPAFDIHPTGIDHHQNAISTIHSLPTMLPAPTILPLTYTQAAGSPSDMPAELYLTSIGHTCSGFCPEQAASISKHTVSLLPTRARKLLALPRMRKPETRATLPKSAQRP